MLNFNGKSIFSIYDETKGIGKIFKGTVKVYESLRLLTLKDISPLKIFSNGGKLVNYKIYGESVQGKLPSKYQQVEYIESTGTQYIDTLINPANKKIGAILDFQFISTLNPKGGVFGSLKTDGKDNIQFTVFSAKWRIKINSFATYSDNYDTQRHIVRLNMRDGTKIDDTLITDTQYTIDSTNTENLYLCACNYDISNETNNYSLIGKLYSAKIYDDETLIRDYIPCYRVSDNVIGLYDLVENKFYTNIGTGAFSKGSNAPTPDAPVEVESVGDKTKNLFDKDNINLTLHKVNLRTSTITPDSTLILQPNTYKLTLFTSNKTDLKYKLGYSILITQDGVYQEIYLENSSVSTNGVFTVDTVTTINGIYVFLSSSDNDTAQITIDNIQLELGDKATEYEPYGYKVPIEVRKENLLKLNDGFVTASAIEYTSKNQIITKKTVSFVNTSYLLQTGPFDAFIGVSKLKAGTYTWYLDDVTGTPEITNPYIVLTTSTGTINWNANTSITLTEEATITQVRSALLTYEVGSTQQFRIRIEEGDTLTEPVTTNIYLKEPLRKIDDYADYIDFESKKLIRNVEKFVVNGSESWHTSLDNGKRRVFLNNRSSVKQNIVLSDKYFNDLVNLSYPDINKIVVNSVGSVIIGVDNTIFPDIETYKTWLKTNNVTIYLPLATPTEETIELPDIPTIKGKTILDIDTNVDTGYFEIEYYGKVKAQTLEENENILINSIVGTDTETELDMTNVSINEMLDEIIKEV